MNSTIKTGIGCTLLSFAWLICLFNCLHDSSSQHWHSLPSGAFHHHHHNHLGLEDKSYNLFKLAEFILPHSHKHDDSSHTHSEQDTDTGQTVCCEPDLRLSSFNLFSNQSLIFYSPYYVALMISNSFQSIGSFLKNVRQFDFSNYISALILNLLFSLSVAANSPPA